MPTLLECDRCGTRAWNVLPNTEFSLKQSIHVLDAGACPTCGSAVAGNLRSEPAKRAFLEEVLFGPAEAPAFDASPVPDGRPRRDHYLFAHGALRTFAFMRPGQCFAELKAEPRATLQRLIEIVWEDGPASERSVALDGIGMSHYRVTHPGTPKGAPCLLIRMPQPRTKTEAFFVAMVLMWGPGATLAERALEAGMLYVTLEAATRTTSPSGTIVGRWLGADGPERANYGRGPRPEADAFIQCVERLVALT